MARPIESSPVFSDDTPKINPWREDRLDYGPFAARLASVVINLEAPNGYVIGLHGAWGAGKSTALNFVKAHIDKHNQELSDGQLPLSVIDFRPWIVSGHQDLISAFFKVFAEALEDRAARHAAIMRWIARKLKGVVDPTIKAAAKIGTTVHPGLALLAPASEVTAKSFEKVLDRWLEEPSLQAAYDDLRQQLEGRKQRFLVVIDDIDRLEPGEIVSIMQMVKTLGRLPNVIYLLAYDRRIVWSALDRQTPIDAGQPSFAEKIVQQELELPPASRHGLLTLLDEETRFMLAAAPDSLRWNRLLQTGVYRWIRYPRDVTRLANAVKFSWPALKGEIDPQDLLCMEGIRLFDNALFGWIRQHREFLLGKILWRLTTGDNDDEIGAKLRASLPPAAADRQIELVSVLFPLKASAIEGTNLSTHGDEPEYETVRRRGVGCEAGYDAYFGLFPSPQAVPKSLIDSAVQQLGDRAVQVQLMAGLIDKRRNDGGLHIVDYLGEIAYRFMGRDAVEPTSELLGAIFEVGDDILALPFDDNLLQVSPRSQLGTVIREILGIWGNKRASAALVEAFRQAKSICLCGDIWLDRARELGVLPSGTTAERPAMISRESFDEVGPLLLQMIQLRAADGSLADAPFFGSLARAWEYMAGTDPVRAWLSAGIEGSSTFLVKAILGLLAISHTVHGRKYRMIDGDRPAYYDLTLIRDACVRHAHAPELTTDEKDRLHAIRVGADEVLKSASPSG